MKSEFGGDHHLSTKGSKRFAHEFFIGERAIRFCGIEKRDAAFDCHPKQLDHLLLVGCRTVGIAHAHTAEPESRNF